MRLVLIPRWWFDCAPRTPLIPLAETLPFSLRVLSLRGLKQPEDLTFSDWHLLPQSVMWFQRLHAGVHENLCGLPLHTLISSECVVFRSSGVFPLSVFASLCVVRGCYIFGDTSPAEDAEL